MYIIYKGSFPKSNIGKLKALKLSESIDNLKGKNMVKVETKKPVFQTNKQEIENIKKELESLTNVIDIKLYPILKIQEKKKPISKKQNMSYKKEKFPPKILHIFFDVDSTLTIKGISYLNSNVLSIFRKFLENNCTLCFCSGRSRKDVDDLRRTYGTGDYGIAENGGIVIGVDKSDETLGDRSEPNKLIKHMNEKGIHYTIDPKQNSRRTEYVLLHDSIEESDLCEAIKASGAKVEYHASKNTYHISAENVHKGSAIEFLTSASQMNLDPEVCEKIGVGDSSLDVPMFKHCTRGFLVGKPTKKIKQELKKEKLTQKVKVLRGIPPKAIEEVYEILFPHG